MTKTKKNDTARESRMARLVNELHSIHYANALFWHDKGRGRDGGLQYYVEGWLGWKKSGVN